MITGNENAFPITENIGLPGLTKREYYAGLAMQGLLSKDFTMFMQNIEDAAKDAVAAADALINALNADQ